MNRELFKEFWHQLPLGFKLLMTFVIVSCVFLISIFFATDFRATTEGFFFDIRTRLKPQVHHIDEIVIVTINKNTVEKLTGKSSLTLPVSFLTQGAEVIQQANPEQAIFLAFKNMFSYEDPGFTNLIEIIARNPNFTLATLTLMSSAPSLEQRPEAIKRISTQARGADTLRARSNFVIRCMPKQGFMGQEQELLLPAYIAQKVGVDISQIPSEYCLNFWMRNLFRTIDLADLILQPEEILAQLNRKIVIVGYSVPTSWPRTIADQPVVNTPLEYDFDTYLKGTPTLFFISNAIENLIHGTWLKPAPEFINILQTMIFTLLPILFWRFGSLRGSIVLIVCWILLLGTHAYLFSAYNLYIPLAETFLLSSISLIVNGLLRVNFDLRESARSRAAADVSRQVETLQSVFLDEFASELGKINASLLKEFDSIRIEGSENLPETSLKIKNLARQSSNEFSEYLAAIHRFVETTTQRNEKISFEKIHPRELLDRVVDRFSISLNVTKHKIIINCDPEMEVQTHRETLDIVFYNFLSNALKYSPNGTDIVVTASISDKKWLSLSVKDVGPGVAREHQQKIFGRFYRVKNDKVYSVKGTGLGLYLCQFFASKVGGKVYCISDPGKGATFYLELPPKP